ncbi:PD-(D/E)XK motif protein [Schumannella soli]|uniref:PD-(D/E)XK motif protein n=1 Tax=Schumannella soli TaxID=2590779 RepID=A0A506XSK5_9MICO|nr:PD-(D/E)XK motif protein [Schumannella soli]TPW75734.1 PD-(D/E)XK motif protein [Schumannella soli]
MIATAIETAMGGVPGRTVGLVDHPHLSMWAQNLGDRPGLLVDVTLPAGVVIEDGRGFDVAPVARNGKSSLLIKPTIPGDPSAAFVGLVEYLYRQTAGVDTPPAAVVALVDSIQEFRRFFGRKSERLSEAEVRGLFSELLLLVELMDAGRSPNTALAAWSGPWGAADFRFADDSAIEVKCVRPSATGVRVSSEYQLEVPSGGMHLFVLPLADADPAATGSARLMDLVGEVSARVAGDPLALRRWFEALDTLGFDTSDVYYEQWSFVPESWVAFEVTDEFPALRVRDLPAGVSGVGYSIALAAAEAFEVDASRAIASGGAK